MASVQVGKPSGPVNVGATIGGGPSNAPVVTVGSNGDGHGLGVTVNVPGVTSIKLGTG